MIEIQQLIVRGRVNGNPLDEHDIKQIIDATIDEYIKNSNLLPDSEKRLIVEECTFAVLEKIEQRNKP